MPSALVSRISVASLRLRYHRDRNGIEVAALLDDVVEDGVMNSHMNFLLPFSMPARYKVGGLNFSRVESRQAVNRPRQIAKQGHADPSTPLLFEGNPTLCRSVPELRRR